MEPIKTDRKNTLNFSPVYYISLYIFKKPPSTKIYKTNRPPLQNYTIATLQPLEQDETIFKQKQ